MTEPTDVLGPPGCVEAIWLRPAARAPLRAVEHARGVADVGLDGDHAVGGRRQLTVLSRELWDAACAELGRKLDPVFRRANVLVAGVPLTLRRGEVLRIGALRVRIEGETRPCELLDDQGGVGLCAALRSEARAGVYGRLLNDAEIRRGDPVAWEAPPA